MNKLMLCINKFISVTLSLLLLLRNKLTNLVCLNEIHIECGAEG